MLFSFTAIESFSVKTVADKHKRAIYVTNIVDKVFDGTNIDDLERPCNLKNGFLVI